MASPHSLRQQFTFEIALNSISTTGQYIYAIISYKDDRNNEYRNLCKTELATNHQNIKFAQKVTTQYFFEITQIIKIDIYNYTKLSYPPHSITNHLSSFQFFIADLIVNPFHKLSISLQLKALSSSQPPPKQQQQKPKPKIDSYCNISIINDDKCCVQFSAQNLPQIRYVNIFR